MHLIQIGRALTELLLIGIPLMLIVLLNLVLGMATGGSKPSIFLGCASIFAMGITIWVVSLRFFWADEYALAHEAGPIEALRESWNLTRNGAWQIFSFQFLIGVLLYPTLLIAVFVFTVILVPLGFLTDLGPGWLAELCILTLGFVIFFIAYASLHAPELAFFYGIRAARGLLDPEELARPTWIQVAKQQAINPA